MIEEVAKVVAVQENSVTVTCEIKSACSGCKQVDNCGSGQVAKAFPQKHLSVTLNTKQALNVGDEVVIGLSEKCVLLAAWQVYLLPLFAMILMAGIGQLLVQEQYLPHELFAIALAAIGGYIGFRFVKFIQKRSQIAKKLVPQLLRVSKNTISVTQISS